MDKLTHLLIRRLRQDARRQALKNGLLHGLLELKLIESNGSIARRYSPLFDTSMLWGNADQDLLWIRRHFASLLMEPPRTLEDGKRGSAREAVVDALSPGPERLKLLMARKLDQASWEVTDEERRAYAIRLLGMASPSPRPHHLITTIVLARALADANLAFAGLIALLERQAFSVVLHSEVADFGEQVVELLQSTDLLPNGRLVFGNDAGSFSHHHFHFCDPGEGRRGIHFEARLLARLAPQSIRRRLVNAASRNLPILTTAEGEERVPDHAMLAADLHLTVRKLDLAVLAEIAKAFHGERAAQHILDDPTRIQPHWLTVDDLVLAFRIGRSLSDTVEILAAVAAANRQAALDEGGVDAEELEQEGSGDERPNASATTSTTKPANKQGHSKSTQKKAGNASQEQQRRLVTSDPARQTSGRGKQDVRSSAEVVEPEPEEGGEGGTHVRRLSIETLAGFGQARQWALDLKADLADYRNGQLLWSDMSTRLLLSGPPGTGKTTFAKALCNSLQIPLVVTSVSSWLEGGHLNDVIRKMSKTFEEARERAPSILFIDEFDGVGKRQPADREYADWWNSVVNRALELLDGAVRSEGVIVIGATNRPNEIDEALRRSGRLETHIEIPRPDIPALADILAFHLGSDVEQLLQYQTPEEATSSPKAVMTSGTDVTQHQEGVQS